VEIFPFLLITRFIFVERMRTISEAEFASYLVRAKQKLETPGVAVDSLAQVVVAGYAGGKGVKRGRRAEVATTSNKAPRLEDDVGALTESGVNEVEGHIPLPLVKGGRTLRSRAAAVRPPAPQGDTAGSEATEEESSKQESLPTWGEDFDPIAFVAENLKGHSSRLDALSLGELRKLAVGSGLKCLALNQLVFTRQEKEAADRLEHEVGTAKEGLKRTHAEVLAKNQARFDKSLAKEKKRLSVLKNEKRNLVMARNSLIVALAKIWKDATKRDADMASLQEAANKLASDLKELEEEVDELNEAMADQYVGGFKAAIEQIQILFPDIDGDVLAQADFLKKIEDGKLVSRLPA
jgi:hypothetical protein